jgi:hypothetical protein
MPKGHSLAGAYAAQARRATPTNFRYLYVTGTYNSNAIRIRQQELTSRTVVPQSELNAFAVQIQPQVSAPTPGDVTITYFFHSK